MTKKRINAPFYTKTKLGLSSLFQDTHLPNGWLYSNGRNKTKITPEDLPENYIPLMVYKVSGFIRLDGIVDMVFKPNYHINHLHKDDFLYVSYTIPIKTEVDQTGCRRYYDYDVLLWGGNIIYFLQELQGKGTYDISKIVDEVKKKEVFYLKKYPEERSRIYPPHILLTQEEYDQAFGQETE